MTIKIINTSAFLDQNPGTSGLRKTVKVFSQPHYLENYVQSIFNTLDGFKHQTLVLGGDGRYFNDRAIQIILKMAAANGIARIMLGQNGILSTPACSCLIRKYHTYGGIILSASHNPGGPNGDFGLKLNVSNGGPASETITHRIFEQSQAIKSYSIYEADDIDLSTLGRTQIGQMIIDIIDPVTDYAQQMSDLFDFEAIAQLFKKGFTLRFDAMHAVNGPYAKEIFQNKLGAAQDTVIHAQPLPDFGGRHPDPNPVDEADLVRFMASDQATDMAVATDGDGDRNLIIGREMVVSPSDSLAILAANAKLIPAYRNGLKGVARSMPTSSAVDRVAEALHIDHYETPTGWKFFGNLLDADRITLCGEESFGTSSHHIREKDGIWAILFWLNLIATTHLSVDEIVRKHWEQFGRNYYSRHDYINIDAKGAHALMDSLTKQLENLPGKSFEGLMIKKADEFTYTDSIDHSVSEHQGIRLFFNDESRIVFRLSGTGTIGATLRIYFDHYEQTKISMPIDFALKKLVLIAEKIACIQTFTGHNEPSMIS